VSSLGPSRHFVESRHILFWLEWGTLEQFGELLRLILAARKP
jgi:hypothetical protein